MNKIIINGYIENDPLSEENLDKTLETVNKIRLLFPNKSIWLYSGYNYQKVMRQLPNLATKKNHDMYKRQRIIKQCDVMIDDKYIDSQRNPSKKWAGSDNQRVISIKQSLQQNKVVLYCD